MQTSNRILDDLAKVAGGAASSFSGLKNEIESVIRQQMARLLSEADVVPRDEFDAIKAVAVKARSEQEKLEKRIGALEAKLGLKAKTATKSKAKPKSAKAAKGSGKTG